MSLNKFFISAAGSGKTTLIVNESLKSNEKILITTFTLNNYLNIRDKIIRNNGYIPPNITIQTWFSFLIEHGIRPYRFWDKRISGMEFVSKISAVRYYNKFGEPVCWDEEYNFNKHYFNSNNEIYSDKLAKLAVRCNEKSDGYVIRRLEKIFDRLYIDEIQDMVGWDLELINLFLHSSINIVLVGDPRQTVYLTHFDKKFKRYRYGNLKEFFLKFCKKVCHIDEMTLINSFRNSPEICEMSSRLYPELPSCQSQLRCSSEHMGFFLVKKRDVYHYCNKFNSIQLRWDKKTKVSPNSDFFNFGESKGSEFDHVLIYPTGPILQWISNKTSHLTDISRAKLYVAITRARFSVGFVVGDNFNIKIEGILLYSPAENSDHTKN